MEATCRGKRNPDSRVDLKTIQQCNVFGGESSPNSFKKVTTKESLFKKKRMSLIWTPNGISTGAAGARELPVRRVAFFRRS
jgi:hypothetical protein